MGEFIKVTIDFGKCVGIKECGGCVRVSPVNIFEEKGNKPEVIEAYLGTETL